MRIAESEFAGRRETLAARTTERGLDGVVLFEPQYVHYYTGFFFIPTERPIAFALAGDGRGGMLVPRLELEHAQANTAVHEVAHYDEYPGDRPPLAALVSRRFDGRSRRGLSRAKLSPTRALHCRRSPVLERRLLRRR